MTTANYEKINDIFQCKLLLEDKTEFIIPLREDGYIYATKLCKIVGKRLSNWFRLKETRKLIDKLEKKVIPHIHTTQLIEVYRGNSGKYLQGTWIHPDLGLQLAQWCSPNFSLQVSKWIRELIITGTVVLGEEKKEEEITKELENKIKELENKLGEKDNVIVSQQNEIKHIDTKFNKLYQNHQSFLKRRNVHKLRDGACVYLIILNPKDGIKIGHSGDITGRIVSGYRTSNPLCQLLYVMYTPHSVMMENNMKIRYDKELTMSNREFVQGIGVEELIKTLHTLADSLKIDYTIETEEQITQFNKHILSYQEKKEIKFDNTQKRCGGITHLTEESRILTLDKFFKHAGNHDGVARLCKECYLTGVYGDKRKKRKVVTIPVFDIFTNKWCNLCESVKEHTDFFKSKDTKDGLNPNCKECKKKQKRDYNKRKKDKIV
jgi:hypothetical protein